MATTQIGTMQINGSDACVEYADKASVKFRGNGLTLNISGTGNRITVGRNVFFSGLTINIQSNDNHIHIGDGCHLAGTFIMKIVDANRINIGKGTTIGGANIICGEGRSVTFGEDCMLAWGIEIRTTDSHALFDVGTDARINHAADVVIGDHVWIAAHSIILKGSQIGSGSVIALRSVVSGKFPEENTVIGGLPAKIIKQGVRWERPLLG
ncbi:MAG: acyltransferase [Ottowia sp.]|uniref:acyltransferase n=1 Tax=unclassified Ottowia TaxID=2645081 RepID=UPI003C2F2A52